MELAVRPPLRFVEGHPLPRSTPFRKYEVPQFDKTVPYLAFFYI